MLTGPWVLWPVVFVLAHCFVRDGSSEEVEYLCWHVVDDSVLLEGGRGRQLRK